MTLDKRNDSTIRQYRPHVGKLVKMSMFADYTERGLNPWSWLRVIGIDRDTVTVRLAPNPTVIADDREQFTIPLYVVDTPIGWEPRYTIHVKSEQLETVMGWLPRGIAVRQSHDMSGSMPTAFQPLTDGIEPNSPHWQFPESTDVIMPDDCPRLIRVVKVEQEEITSETLGYPAVKDCPHCHGSGRRSVAELAGIRKETLATTWNLVNTGEIHLDDMTDTDFRCHCHYGAVSRMGRTERGQLFKKMRADGWVIEFVRYGGGYWERSRETVVKDWEE